MHERRPDVRSMVVAVVNGLHDDDPGGRLSAGSQGNQRTEVRLRVEVREPALGRAREML